MNIVITGSSRGIGKALATAFCKLGHHVLISGRTKKTVNDTVALLKKNFGPDCAYGTVCDVTQYNDCEKLWRFALREMGNVDVWISNAGVSHDSVNFSELEAGEIERVLATNTLGLLYSTGVALRGMKKQGSGFIYTMEGLGSNNMVVEGSSIYGMSKAALTYFTRALIKEEKNSPVAIGFISPGMVTTDLLTGGIDRASEQGKKALKIFNILADRPETVAPWIAQKIIANKRHGARISWLTTQKILWRFATAPLFGRKVIE